MGAITVTSIPLTGVAVPSLTAASAGGDTIVPADDTFLIVANGGGSAIIVTVDSLQTCDQGADHDLVVSVAAGVTKWLKVGPSSRFRNGSGVADVSYSGVTSVTVGGGKIAA